MVQRTTGNPIFRPTFASAQSGQGRNPVVFDILSPDGETSILPDDMKLVLHVNPQTFSVSYEKAVERIQTKGGWVEQHWGEGPRSLTLNMATGGFKRLYSGLSNITGGAYDAGGTRRETIAYDKYLDVLALFHNNGSIYDSRGQIVLQGFIQVMFEGGIYFGWFSGIDVEESAESPYQFTLSGSFTISHEILRLRSVPSLEPGAYNPKPYAEQQRGAEEFGNLEIPQTVPYPRPGRAVNPTGNVTPVQQEEISQETGWNRLTDNQRLILQEELEKRGL